MAAKDYFSKTVRLDYQAIEFYFEFDSCPSGSTDSTQERIALSPNPAQIGSGLKTPKSDKIR